MVTRKFFANFVTACTNHFKNAYEFTFFQVTLRLCAVQPNISLYWRGCILKFNAQPIF